MTRFVPLQREKSPAYVNPALVTYLRVWELPAGETAVAVYFLGDPDARPSLIVRGTIDGVAAQLEGPQGRCGVCERPGHLTSDCPSWGSR